MWNGKISNPDTTIHMAQYYMHRLFTFFDQLRSNNTRPWFAEHKAEYQDLRNAWLSDIDTMMTAMSQWEPWLAHQTARQCAYRIYRDTRFSPDKTPFKLNFSAAFAPSGKSDPHAAYYIETGLRPNGSGLYGGVYCPEPATLKKLRHAIVDNIEEFEQIIHNPELEKEFPGWIGQRLKTIPKGWEKGHPQTALLQLKEYGKAHFCNKQYFLDPAWPQRSAHLFSLLKPLIDFLNYSIDE